MKRQRRTARGRTKPEAIMLTVRRARSEDRDAILAMSEKIWGGNDYLPLVWDRWLADTKGRLLTVTHEGVPVGVAKISVLGPGEVWLEGLRLHPDLHGKGLTRQINAAALRAAAKLNPKTIRFSTWIGNTASRHIGETRGFWLIARARWMWGRPRKHTSPGTRVARPEDLDEVERFIKESPSFAAATGVFGIGWKFYSLTRRRIRGMTAAGRVLVRPRHGSIRAVAIHGLSEIDGEVCLGFVDGPEDDVASLARDVLGVAAELGHEEATAMLPVGPIADAVLGAGYNLRRPPEAVVYELGAHGRPEEDEDLESLLWRTLRVNEEEAADTLADLLVTNTSGTVARENVRDFVMRHVLPDTPRQTYEAFERFTEGLPTFTLRRVLWGVAGHLATRHGIAGDAVTVGKSRVSFRYCGRCLATVHTGSRALKVSLGPGFGPCFPPDLDVDVDRLAFAEDTLDSESGLYAGLTMWLAGESHVTGAAAAIDLIMKKAERVR